MIYSIQLLFSLMIIFVTEAPFLEKAPIIILYQSPSRGIWYCFIESCLAWLWLVVVAAAAPRTAWHLEIGMFA
jgi:hypothetical protein